MLHLYVLLYTDPGLLVGPFNSTKERTGWKESFLSKLEDDALYMTDLE